MAENLAENSAENSIAPLADSKRPGAVMQHREFAAPIKHGSKLFDPDLTQWSQLWSENLKLRDGYSSLSIDQTTMGQLQRTARAEMVQLARRYSDQYSDSSQRELPLDPTGLPAILMAGHQPSLFHPGVWFKNFCLSAQAERLAAIPINLIVDHDLCDHRQISIPADTAEALQLIDLPIDQPSAACPFEGAWVENAELFQSAGARIQTALTKSIQQPIISRLWPEVMTASQHLGQDGRINFGQALAAGRHRLEQSAGLNNLEIPISQLARTQSFAQFAWHLLLEAERFRELHNRGLQEYRNRFNLRSKTHPFPDLDTRDQWIETPFWILVDSGTRRNPLYVRAHANGWEISDLKQSRSLDLRNSTDLFSRFESGQIQLRPRAVTTTLYSRLILSDLFIHGIGGGKYDLLTDWIAENFWQIRLPEFCVVSATHKLLPQYPRVNAEQIQLQKQQLRELEMNPDKFLMQNSSTEIPAEIQMAIEQKQGWIRGSLTGTGKERHQALAECNRLLNQWIEPVKQARLAQLSEDQQRLTKEQNLGSREFSFCLHPIELIQQLVQC